ncbi:hypothetical protein PVAND_007531 [Polypedilum vanderplanki]|uniref:Intimal thickness related receptor IRP domain-containing protein n=1 Tax=Polypedilum vanderplanki TaxID=319348 RepID=A0A9J6C7L5_POLVA|nr:hypothetical protein PVAND_007531 [Polypedilum vanderplanki]
MKVIGFFLFLILLVAKSKAKYVEGHIKTLDDWVFVSRFCFLSESGRYEYLIEYEKKYGDLQLLLYYDEPHQWHSVYKTAKTCQEKISVLSVQDNQIVTLSARSPYFIKSGCTLRTVSKNEANEQLTTSAPKPAVTTNKNKNEDEIDSTYFDKFLKSTSEMPPVTDQDIFNSSSSAYTTEENFTDVDADNFNFTDVDYKTLVFDQNSQNNNLENSTEYRTDVEEMFEENPNENANRTKRQTYSRSYDYDKKQTILVSCHNTGTFTSARQRWWYIALANCGSTKGIDVRFRFKMTNGIGFWNEHFSADEMYIPPVLLVEILCYTFLLLTIFLCGLELKTRQLYHCTYRLFTLSAVLHWSGVLLNSVTWAKYAMSGTGPFPIFGGFLNGASEIAFLLLMLLMAKGYTITRARLSTASTVKITVFINLYIVVYISLYVYQSEVFDQGEVLNLYESGSGYAIAILRCFAWGFFLIACTTTLRKFPEKRSFYLPFAIFGSLWILAGPILIFLIVGNLDAWVRESVCFMAFAFVNFSGFCVFLWITWPSRANKSFPYHVKTNHIGIANSDDDGSDYPRHTYEPSSRVPDASIIIPLSRRTEEFVTSTTGIYNAGFVRDYMRTTSHAPHSIPQQCMISQSIHHRLPSPTHEPPPLMSITNDRLYGKDTLNNDDDDDDDSDTLETESGIVKHSADNVNNRMSSFESEESVANETGRRQISQDNDSGHLSLEASTSPNSNENSSTPLNDSLESNKQNSPDNLPAILKDNTFKVKAPNKILLDPIKLPSLMNTLNNTTNIIPSSNTEVPRHLFTVKKSDQ